MPHESIRWRNQQSADLRNRGINFTVLLVQPVRIGLGLSMLAAGTLENDNLVGVNINTNTHCNSFSQKSRRKLDLTFNAIAVMLFSIALHVVGAAFLSSITTAQQISNDPPSYFGGTQNQEYLDWVRSGIDSKYNSSVYLPSIDQANGAAVHWTVDGDWLHIAVAARCSGWIGFGISEAGGMKGSDMALFTASRPTELIDAHVIENRVPGEDSCQQDWILSDSSVLGEFLAFEARRKLDTGDPQDKKIVDDSDGGLPPSRIIAGWGNTVEVSYHGTNVARGSVRFYSGGDDASSFQALVETNAEGSFLVFTNNFTIPSEEVTNYIDFCVSRSDLIAQGVPNTTDALYLIGFRPIVSPLSAAYVHHFVVTASMDSTESACGEDADANNLVYGM